MNFKEEQAKSKSTTNRFREWAAAEITRRLDKVEETGEIEGYCHIRSLARIVIKVPSCYRHVARLWDMFKRPVNDPRITNIGVYETVITVYHGERERV